MVIYNWWNGVYMVQKAESIIVGILEYWFDEDEAYKYMVIQKLYVYLSYILSIFKSSSLEVQGVRKWRTCCNGPITKSSISIGKREMDNKVWSCYPLQRTIYIYIYIISNYLQCKAAIIYTSGIILALKNTVVKEWQRLLREEPRLWTPWFSSKHSS